MSAGSVYSTRPALLPAERELVLAVWEGTLGERDRMASKFSWFYEQSPTGAPLTLLLEWRPAPGADAQVIGVATAGRRRFHCGNQALSAGVLVDMAVRPQHRTLGPALQLQKSLLAEGRQELGFLYGFPNPKAAPVFQRAGYQRLGMTQRRVRVLRVSGYLARRMPRLAARLLSPFADLALRIRLELHAQSAGAPRLSWGSVESLAASQVCSSEAPPGTVCGIRTPEFLSWRFRMAGVGATHHAVVATLAETAVYWVLEVQGKVLQVRDCSPNLLETMNRTAWLALFRDAARRGFHSVSFECLASARRLAVLESLGMTVRSERPVFWSGVRPDQSWQEAAEFFLTSADEDE